MIWTEVKAFSILWIRDNKFWSSISVICSLIIAWNLSILSNDALKKGFDLFVEAETEAVNTYGKQGKSAQKIRQDIHRSLSGPNGQYSFSSGNKALLISFDSKGNLLFKNGEKGETIQISEYNKNFETNDNNEVLKENYEKTIMSLAREKAKEWGAQDIVLTDSNQKYLLADKEGILTHNENYYPSELDKVNNKLFNDLINIKTGKDVDLSLGTGELLKNAVLEFKKEYENIADSKDSQIFKDATESYVSNSGYAKVIGQNAAYSSSTAGMLKNEPNKVWMTSDAIRGLLRLEGGAQSDWLNHIQNLQFQLAELNGGKLSKTTANSNSSIKELQQIESELIEGIIKRVKEGAELLGQFHRYPSTNGNDIKFAKVGIDDKNLSNESIAISRGLANTVNADYDGDKMWRRILMASTNFTNLEDYDAAYKAAQEIEKLDAQVAKHMEQWEANKPSSSDTGEESFISDLENKEPNYFSSLISKWNKQYVGQFSNVSTNARNFLEDTGVEQASNGNLRNGGLVSIVRAYLESLEQDAISAKKVFARISKNTNSTDPDVALNELSKLYGYVSTGSFKEAVIRIKIFIF